MNPVDSHIMRHFVLSIDIFLVFILAEECIFARIGKASCFPSLPRKKAVKPSRIWGFTAFLHNFMNLH